MCAIVHNFVGITLFTLLYDVLLVIMYVQIFEVKHRN